MPRGNVNVAARAQPGGNGIVTVRMEAGGHSVEVNCNVSLARQFASLILAAADDAEREAKGGPAIMVTKPQ